MAGTQPSLVSVPAGPGHKSVQEGTQVLNAYSSAEHLGNGSRPRNGQEILLPCRPQTNTSTFAYPEVVAAGREDCLVSVEFLFLGYQGHVTENAITSLLIQCCEDGVIVRF